MTVRGLHAGSTRMDGIGLHMFTDDELYDIHLATLDVLWNIGVKVESEEAREIFYSNGCTLDRDTNIVKIPAHLVEDALRSIPKTFRACGRNPENDWLNEGNRTGFVNFGEAVTMIDPYTRQLRKPLKEDVDDVTRFCEAMEQVIIFERAMGPSEVDPDVAQVHIAESFYNHSTKHAYIGMNRPENMRAAAKMGYVVSGGEENFRARPLFSQSTDPVSPMVHSKGATDTLIQAIRLGVPAKVNSMGLAGGTTCVNLASTLVTHNAEILSMFVLSQLVKKGHPMVYGTSTTMIDLRTTVACVGTPELALFSSAVAKLAQFYNIPSWVAGG
ncbi:Glycine betaine methyltransferase [Sporomusa acidovorans DSM 3132]|uniref:Glycine betaine methyltransferase n=1 Tax=Sporomusa acidovorans (strain ATCC 49682 / DSM 3132 / Mol) TaxID=1123286 RepID=A0ABZ3J7C8_SPOA4|nr:trimethylamine methyltransferase MttB [Sporomusa acidovorans DSM 3132]SDE65797.1 trimethylamine---corrinoid protein Co-methyltransferase [Sporomusa acidovorans]